MSENKAVPVVLAGRDFVVKRIPMARVKRIGKQLTQIVGDLSKKDIEKDNDAVTVILDKIIEFPYEVLSLFIKDLPRDIFEDEEEGVTFPEFLSVLNTAMEVNRLDALKNGFSRLMPMAIQAYQASTSQKAN